ncbi:hypothetical protein C8R44DRAFT_767927 [Mycena epipterygia]|nr:hypothetical protein C8R44DRAFT_767927 [Mycena epipterygia]
MPPRQPVDLKKVGKLFSDTIAAVRDDNPNNDALEPQAKAWLKAARYKLMRQIEASYYELDRARNTPLLQPAWINPSSGLYLSTDRIPTMLAAYIPAFHKNLATLVNDCGFHNCAVYSGTNTISLTISFPVPQRVEGPAPPAAPDTLDVEDEFSRMARGEGAAPHGDRKPSVGAFAATDFARLLGDARGEGASGSKTKSTAGKKRPASRAAKVESDDEGPRLRSVTRASSTVTLRSSSGNVRRSGRKRAKREEE